MKPSRSVVGRVAILAAFASIVTAGGCTFAPAPLQDTPKVVATPEKGQLTVTSEQSKPIGDVVPVYVSVANGTDDPRAIVPSQIFALDDAGQRIAPLPPGEAARQAGGAGELTAAVKSAAATGAVTGAIGAGIGAVAGAFIHSGATGAALGGAIGGGQGVLQGATAGPAKADAQANQQISALALPEGDVRQDFTVSGYVFFPKGDYKQIQLLMVDSETGNTEIVTKPWQ